MDTYPVMAVKAKMEKTEIVKIEAAAAADQLPPFSLSPSSMNGELRPLH